MADFKLKRIAELHRQLMLSPPRVRRRHADRLERLLLELEPDRTYPYEFVHFRVTGFRPSESYLDTFRGEELRPDLHRSLELVSQSVPQPVEELDERVYTIPELADRFDVSRRTIHRWRRRGLVARHYIFPDGVNRVGVRAEVLERFVIENEGDLHFGGGYSRLTDEEERRALARVKEYREAEELSTTAAAAKVAEELGRSQETVRLVLKRHGEAGRQHGGRLSESERRQIYTAYREGEPVDELCSRYDRSRASIYRVVNQERARDLLAEPLNCYAEEDFCSEEARERILGEDWRRLWRRLEGSPDGEAALSAQEEDALFRAYNYLKWQALRLRQRVDPSRYVSSRRLEEIDELMARTAEVAAAICRHYRPVVERIVRQHSAAGGSFDRLMARALGLLPELVESHDYRRAARFEQHLSLALQKAFARLR